MVGKDLNLYDLPGELIEMIHHYFELTKDINTQKSLRLVCKAFYKMFPQIREFDDDAVVNVDNGEDDDEDDDANVNDNLVKTHIFTNEKFKTVLSSGFIIRQIVFEPLGKYKFVEYNNKNILCKIIINNPPYELIMYEKTESSIMIKKIISISSKNNSTEISHFNDNINKYNPFPTLNISRVYPFNNANLPMCIIS